MENEKLINVTSGAQSVGYIKSSAGVVILVCVYMIYIIRTVIFTVFFYSFTYTKQHKRKR